MVHVCNWKKAVTLENVVAGTVLRMLSILRPGLIGVHICVGDR